MKDFPEYWAETGQYIREKDCLGGNAFRAGQRYQTAKAKGSTELALLADNERLTKWLEWIAAHSVTETEIPGEDYPYCNMPPNEGADAALRGQSIEEYDES